MNARVIPGESVGIKMYDIKGDVRVFRAIENGIIHRGKAALRRGTWSGLAIAGYGKTEVLMKLVTALAKDPLKPRTSSLETATWLDR